MSNPTAKFKVTLEFEVDVDPISVPDAATFEKFSTPADKKKNQLSEKDLRAAMKNKGMSDKDIDEAVKKSTPGQSKRGKPKNYQMLLYPEYEAWAEAQISLQQEILDNEALCADYVREMVRDLTRGRIEALLDEHYGTADVNRVLKAAARRLSAEQQATLKAEQEALLFDETELVDASVSLRCAGLQVSKA